MLKAVNLVPCDAPLMTCRRQKLALRCLIGGLLLWLLAVVHAAPPALELVDVYRGGVPLERYWVSEKYDGVRGYWDGRQLWTRGGQRIHAPPWFTQGWPDTPLDGELWAGYGGFEHASKTIRADRAADADWRRIRYLVFDLPASPALFDGRIVALREVVARIGLPWVVAVRQFKVASDAELRAALRAVVARRGEGLVLHRGDAPYRPGRGVGLLKVKPFDDAEARVVAIHPGSGQFTGLMGSLRVRTPDGREFSIGTGFSRAQRQAPPAVGAWITYRFRGHTASGLPPFASFLRERPEGPSAQ
jgi:DNA ligase-1